MGGTKSSAEGGGRGGEGEGGGRGGVATGNGTLLWDGVKGAGGGRVGGAGAKDSPREVVSEIENGMLQCETPRPQNPKP